MIHFNAEFRVNPAKISQLLPEGAAYSGLAYPEIFANEVQAWEKDKRRPHKKVSHTDPEAGYMARPGKPNGFYYLSHQTTDPDWGIITAVTVTPGDVHDSRPYLEQIEYVHKNVIPIQAAAADSAYDLPLAHRVLEELGIDFFVVPQPAHDSTKAEFKRDVFTYHGQRDVYLCPDGKELRPKGDKTPDTYTPDQVRSLMERVAGTEWEMPVVLGGLYGMRRSEILGLRWRNVDLEQGTFDVVEQLPFKVPPHTTTIQEMAPPKSNGRRLPITDMARPFFERQLARLEADKQAARQEGRPFYENNLVVCKANGAPQAANWISSGFGKLLAGLDMPHIRFHDLRHTAATNMHQLTGDFYTVGEVLGHTLAGIEASLGLSMNFEAVTARYVDVRLERKKEVLDAYHAAVHPAPMLDKAKQERTAPAKKKDREMSL